MSIENLIGFRLESIRFSKGSYTLDVQGKLNGEPKTYHVGTSYYLSPSLEELIDIEDAVSTLTWELLETEIINIETSDTSKYLAIIIEFENKKKLVFWQNKPAMDNLLIIRDPFSEAWFVTQ